MTVQRAGFLRFASVAALLGGVLLTILAGPGQAVLGDDPRVVLCGSDCFPVAYPWFLMTGVATIVGGLVGLKIVLRRASQ